MRKEKDPEPDPDPYLRLIDPDPGGPKSFAYLDPQYCFKSWENLWYLDDENGGLKEEKDLTAPLKDRPKIGRPRKLGAHLQVPNYQ